MIQQSCNQTHRQFQHFRMSNVDMHKAWRIKCSLSVEYKDENVKCKWECGCQECESDLHISENWCTSPRISVQVEAEVGHQHIDTLTLSPFSLHHALYICERTHTLTKNFTWQACLHIIEKTWILCFTQWHSCTFTNVLTH